MPKVLKGDIAPRSKHPWEEYFDGRKRIFFYGKDFKNKHSFSSSIHQAARRLGATVRTKSDGKNIELQAMKGKRTTKKVARKPATKRAPAKRKAAPRKAKTVSNGIAHEAAA